MASAKLIDIAALHPISVIQPKNTKNTVSGKAVADYVEGGSFSGNISGDVDLDNIKCKTIEISGDRTTWSDNTNNNIDLGNTANIIGGNFNGNINLAYNSTISAGKQYGNITLGSTSKFEGGEQYGNIIAGAEATLGESNHTTYGNVILGQRAYINNYALHHGNILLGEESTVVGGIFSGNIIFGGAGVMEDNITCNIIAGNDFRIDSQCTASSNTVIIGSLTHNSDINTITNRNGLILVGGDASGSAYQVYWPNNETKAAEQHGYVKCRVDYNLLDKDGEYIIQNGKLIENSSSGNDIDLSNIKTQSLEVTGNGIDWTDVSYTNLDLGRQSKLSGGNQYGNVNLGYNSSINQAYQSGNVNLGRNSRISGGSQSGNANLGAESTISGGWQNGNINLGQLSTILGGYQYGNINLGNDSTISGGARYGNVNLGAECIISDRHQYGNTFTGVGLEIHGNCDTTYNTWIIAGLSNQTNFESQITNRYGLTLIGNAGDCGLNDGGNYRVYWPNVSGYDAQIHGNIQWMSDHNIKDANGNLVVENGQLVGGGSSGGSSDVDLSNIKTESLEVTGNNINYSSWSNSNLDLGSHATISYGAQWGNVNLGYNSTISGGLQYANTNLGGRSVISNGNQHGNVNLGNDSTISGGEQYGNVSLGSNSTINGGVISGNIFIGSGLEIHGNCDTTYNTWIIAGISPYTNFETQVTKRYGLTLIGTCNQCGPDESGHYKVYWPNVSGYDAQIHGNTQWTEDHNIKDKDGNLVVENGKLTGPKIVICENESELPSPEEQKDGVIYITLED